MFTRLRYRALSSFLGMALLIGGCPTRRTARRLVYIPAPPPTAAPPPAKPAEALAIEEPPPPAPPHENAPSTPAAPSPAHRPRRTTTEPSDTEEVLPEPEEPPPTVEVPALEPRESREKETALRNQVLRLQNDVKQQIAQLEGAQFAPTDRKTLEDARTFLAQSEKALEEGDLQRSLNLARKASLLVAALRKERQ